MRRRFTRTLLFIFVVSFFFAGCVFAAEKTKSAKDLTQGELIERIKFAVGSFPEIANYIPELRITRDAEGNIVKAEYNAMGIFEDLEDLEKDDLVSLYKRVTSERTRLQTLRIQKQLEMVKQAMNAHRAAQSYKAPPRVPSVPKTTAPPPSPPKIPVPPPLPPAERR